MTDAIKLPPLPYPQIPGNDYDPRDMWDYALAAIKADRQQRGERQAELLSKFFAALDEATALDSKQSQWSTKPVGTPHDRIVAWAEVHKLRGILAPQPTAPDNFQRAKEIVETWPGWKRDYVLVKPAAPAVKESFTVTDQAHWQQLSAHLYQAAGAFNMPVRFLDVLTSAANGEPFAHMLDDLLPVMENEGGVWDGDSATAQEPSDEELIALGAEYGGNRSGSDGTLSGPFIITRQGFIHCLRKALSEARARYGAAPKFGEEE